MNVQQQQGKPAVWWAQNGRGIYGDLSRACDGLEWSRHAVFTPDDDGRLTLVIYTGAASIHLRPTAAEARELIAALQWALEPAEQLTGEVAA